MCGDFSRFAQLIDQVPAMKFLKDGAWDLHLRLEKRLAIKDRFSEIVPYRDHLTRLWGFHAAAETQWSGFLRNSLDDFPDRLKAPLLARDIEAIGGVAPSTLASVPHAADPLAALGGFYVLEGATLGGQYLLPIVQRKLGLSASHGAQLSGELWTGCEGDVAAVRHGCRGPMRDATGQGACERGGARDLPRARNLALRSLVIGRRLHPVMRRQIP